MPRGETRSCLRGRNTDRGVAVTGALGLSALSGPAEGNKREKKERIKEEAKRVCRREIKDATKSNL